MGEEAACHVDLTYNTGTVQSKNYVQFSKVGQFFNPDLLTGALDQDIF